MRKLIQTIIVCTCLYLCVRYVCKTWLAAAFIDKGMITKPKK
jgi:hypothetical protein